MKKPTGPVDVPEYQCSLVVLRHHIDLANGDDRIGQDELITYKSSCDMQAIIRSATERLPRNTQFPPDVYLSTTPF